MATSQIYSYAINDGSMRRGPQTLRGSHEIIPDQPVEVGHERQLLMDWRVVDDLNGCRRTVHQPVKHPDNPILTAEPPYEHIVFYSYGTILREPETGQFRIWTSAADRRTIQAHGKVPGSMFLVYFESEDGLHWRRPELGLCELDGTRANNVFLRKNLLGSPFVLRLPQRLRDRGRYGMVYQHNVPNDQLPDPDAMHGMRQDIAFSDDGIRWTEAPENPVWGGRSDTNNCIVYNPERDVFMMYRRATINAGEIRRIAYAESPDLVCWSQPRTVVRRDEIDPLMLYGMPVSRYRGVYLGFLFCLHMHPDREQQVLADGRDFKMDTQLAWSRDGIRWERHPARPTFLPVSAPFQGAYDWGFATGMANIIEMDDEVRIYYGGREYLHGPGVKGADTKSHICLATLRRDGFVSVDADDNGGYMLTRPLAYPGGRLHINAKTAGDGFIKVAVREGQGVRDGEWPEGWRFEDSAAFTGDDLDAPLAWAGSASLKSFPSRVLRLHFWMEKAELYSFWFE